MTIPAGPLRESINNLQFYDNIILNGNLENVEKLKKEIYKINPNLNVHLGKYEPLNLNEFEMEKNYFLFSGIGNHQTFVSMLKNNGLKIIKDIEFPDHYKYTETDINNILIEAKNLECQIITTEKDYFRLGNKYLDKFKIIKSELKIVDEDKFIKSLIL